jgi:hypothetical protein
MCFRDSHDRTMTVEGAGAQSASFGRDGHFDAIERGLAANLA